LSIGDRLERKKLAELRQQLEAHQSVASRMRQDVRAVFKSPDHDNVV
jgi:hypothetical protein